MSHKALAGVAVTVLLAVTPATGGAQTLRQRWGVTMSFAPQWKVPDYQARFLNADTVDLSGTDVRVGVTRGRLFGGDFGVSFVRRTIADREAAVVKDDGTILSTRADTLVGVAIQGFKPFATIRQHAQIGLSFGAGVGRYRGIVVQRRPGLPATEVEAPALFSFESGPVQVTPLGTLELTGTAIVGTHVKIRASGGVSFPGQQVLNIGLTYFF